MKLSKFKNNTIIVFIYLFFFLIGDIAFSNLVYKKEVLHNCYTYLEKFYYLKKNCYSKEKWIKKIKSYDVYTDNDGFRYSGKKNKHNKNIAVFLGGSFTYGLGHSYEKSFVGIIDNKQTNFRIMNLGVPGYSPSVFEHQLNKLSNKGLQPKKIFLVLDLIDVHNEAARWKKKLTNNEPVMVKKIDNQQKVEIIESFKDKNFKASRILARTINNFFRSVRLDLLSVKKQSLKPGYSGWGSFTYKKLENTNENLWLPFGFKNALSKIETNYSEISKYAKSINSDVYIIIFPWSDTIEYGQKNFNWEQFAIKLCHKTSCKKVLNFFPDFMKIKRNDGNWLNYLFIEGDLHLTEQGQEIVASKILKEAF
jgi:hypothetical protein